MKCYTPKDLIGYHPFTMVEDVKGKWLNIEEIKQKVEEYIKKYDGIYIDASIVLNKFLEELKK